MYGALVNSYGMEFILDLATILLRLAYMQMQLQSSKRSKCSKCSRTAEQAEQILFKYHQLSFVSTKGFSRLGHAHDHRQFPVISSWQRMQSQARNELRILGHIALQPLVLHALCVQCTKCTTVPVITQGMELLGIQNSEKLS